MKFLNWRKTNQPLKALKIKNNGKIWASLHPFYEGGGLLGRKEANRGFLQALLQADPYDSYHFYLGSQGEYDGLQTALRQDFPKLWQQGRLVLQSRRKLPQALHELPFHCFHLSDCFTDFSNLVRARNALSRVIFPITAPTHSISYHRFHAALLEECGPHITSRDSIICTARSGLGAMQTAFNTLRENYGLAAEQFPNPRLSLIPLGCNPTEIVAEPGGEEWAALRRHARQKIAAATRQQKNAANNAPNNVPNNAPGAPGSAFTCAPGNAANGLAGNVPNNAPGDMPNTDNMLVLLAFARLSTHSKMDYLPIFQALRRVCALQEAAPPQKSANGKPHFVLVLAGWVEEGDKLPELLRAVSMARGIDLKIVPCPGAEERRALYAGADIFLSPSDNLQETFGLTLLEAAAAGLPVLASDFDGYKDLVEHGKSGFLLPTTGPADAPLTDALAGLLYDSDYHLYLAQQCVIDVPALAAALLQLAQNPAQRREMGAYGRARVLRRFTWQTVIAEHIKLWEDLNALPLGETGCGKTGFAQAILAEAGLAEMNGEDKKQNRAHNARAPMHPPYMRMFSGYFTRQMRCAAENTRLLRWSASGEALYRGREIPVFYAELAGQISEDGLKQLLFHARKPITPQKLFSALQSLPQPPTLDPEFLIFWAIKHDFLEFCD